MQNSTDTLPKRGEGFVLFTIVGEHFHLSEDCDRMSYSYLLLLALSASTSI